MRLRVIAPVLLAIAAVVGLVLGAVLPGQAALTGQAGKPASGQGDGAVAVPEGSGEGVSAEPGSNNGSVSDTNGPQPEYAVTKLEAGGPAAPGKPASGLKPPQFVVVSFDGACKTELFKHYLDVAQRNNARFTFFLSGLCIVPDAKRFDYKPPLKPAGTSAIGFGEVTNIPDRIRDLTAAYEAGHEIGTHALGHFCGKGGVDDWNSAQWKSELTQFNGFVDNWRDNLPPALAKGLPVLPFNSSVVQGIRTPCLEGSRSQMLPVFRDFGYSYNASDGGELAWPITDKYGLWEFPLQTIKVVGYDRSNLSMDYNFLCAQNDCVNTATTDVSDRIETSTKESFDAALKAVCRGNRAPFFVGNHFNNWVNGAYKNALTQFVDGAKDVCPDVQFISNADLVKWLNAQSPAVLESLQARGTQSS